MRLRDLLALVKDYDNHCSIDLPIYIEDEHGNLFTLSMKSEHFEVISFDEDQECAGIKFTLADLPPSD